MKKLLTVFFLLIAISTSANKIYINYSTGDDATGNGSLATPYKTLYKAATVAATYDTIVPAAGMTYFETSQILLPVKVNIMGGDSATTIFQSTVSANFTSMLLLASGTEGTDGSQFITGVKFIGNNYTTGWGISITARDSVQIYGCSFTKFREVGINFSGIVAQNGPDAPTVYATGNKFYNNRVIDCSKNDTVYGRGCLQFGGQDGFKAYNNYIVQPYRTAGFTGNIGWPMKMANEGHIKNCKVYNDTLQRALFTGAAHGINNDWNFSFEMWNIEGLEMYGNVLQGEVDIVNATKGSSAYGLHFHDNICTYPARSNYFQSGLRLETDEQDIEIRDNRFEHMEQAITYSPHDYPENPAVTGIFIRRNKIYRNYFKDMGNISGAHSTLRFDGTQVEMENFEVYNNTFESYNTLMAFIIPGFTSSFMHNTIFNNNIVKGYTYAPVFIGFLIDTFKVKNNCFSGNGNGDTTLFNAGRATNYINSGNITSNPLIVSDTLSAASPCIDAGIDMALPYNGSAPDMGYYETGGADITAPTVTATNPTDGAINVTPGAYTVVISFSEVMGSNGAITGLAGTQTGGSGFVNIAATLLPSTLYTVTITGATDVAGNVLATTSFSFTTGTAPAVGDKKVWRGLLKFNR